MNFLLIISVTVAVLYGIQAASLKLSHISCESFEDKLQFEYCDIKAVKRDFNYLRLKILYEQISPIRNLSVKYRKLGIQLMKRENGWKPYLYAVRTDLCQFLKKPNNPIMKLFINFIRGHINVKLQCPFESPVILNNISNAHIKNTLKGLPLPLGDYAIFSKWYKYGNHFATVKIQCTIVY